MPYNQKMPEIFNLNELHMSVPVIFGFFYIGTTLTDVHINILVPHLLPFVALGDQLKCIWKLNN